MARECRSIGLGAGLFPLERFLPFVVEYILRVSGYQQAGDEAAIPAGTDCKLMRIYDQVSLTRPCTSGFFQLFQQTAHRIIDRGFTFGGTAQFQQLLAGVEQRQHEHQLGIAAFKGAADFVQPGIDERFHRLNLFGGGRTPDRNFPAKHRHQMGRLHTASRADFTLAGLRTHRPPLPSKAAAYRPIRLPGNSESFQLAENGIDVRPETFPFRLEPLILFSQARIVGFQV